MRKALRDVVLPEAPEQANGGEQVEEGAPDATEAPRRTETWPHDDIRNLTRAGAMMMRYNVGLLLMCGACNQTLKLEGRDNGGASFMGCGCAVRRWL